MGKGVARIHRDKSGTFGTNEEFLKVISRGELNNFRNNPRAKVLHISILNIQ